VLLERGQRTAKISNALKMAWPMRLASVFR
jgi:hypothetical protein